MAFTEPRPFRWTIEDYYRLSEAPWFHDRHVQLIDGQLLEWPPLSPAHAAAVSLTEDALTRALGPGLWVRVQAALCLGPTSAPEPDLAVLPGRPGDYKCLNAALTALLVVEVSDGSLAYDRTTKASLYAQAHVADYWVLNLVERRLEVHREPTADAAQPFGYRYASRTVLGPGERAAPLLAPQASIAVTELLP